MKFNRYLLISSFSTFLLLSACNFTDETTEENNTEVSTNTDSETEQYMSDLENENDELKEQVTELENELSEIRETMESLEAMEIEESSPQNETNSNNEGTRSNPLTLGDIATIDVTINGEDYDDRFDGVIELTVHDVIIGDEAYEMLVEENQFNDPAPEGYEWALVDVNLELIESETEDHAFYVMDLLEIVESDGSTAPRESAVTPNSFGGDHIYSGGSSSGYSSALVPEGDTFLIKYDGRSSGDVFFESP